MEVSQREGVQETLNLSPDITNNEFIKTKVIPNIKEHGDEIGIKTKEDVEMIFKMAKKVEKILKKA